MYIYVHVYSEAYTSRYCCACYNMDDEMNFRRLKYNSCDYIIHLLTFQVAQHQ